METLSPEDVEEQIIFWSEWKEPSILRRKKGEFTDQLLKSIYEYLIDNKYPDKILVKETKIER